MYWGMVPAIVLIDLINTARKLKLALIVSVTFAISNLLVVVNGGNSIIQNAVYVKNFCGKTKCSNCSILTFTIAQIIALNSLLLYSDYSKHF